MENKPQGSWLTVNRFCNFRCPWCYAQESKFSPQSNMSFETAAQIVDLCQELGIKKMIIIGGEPLFWPHFFKLLELLEQKGMASTLVTNGFLLGFDKVFRKIRDSSLKSVSLSLKAGDAEQYLQITGKDSLEKVMLGAKNIAALNLDSSISITLNSLIIDRVDDLVKIAADCGAKSASLQFCATTFKDGLPQKGYMAEPKLIVDTIVKKFNKWQNYLGGRLLLEQSLPQCIWPKGFLDDLEKNNRVYYGCHVMRREGIIFDPLGRLIPCNCMSDVSLGTFGQEFKSAEEFYQFWQSQEVINFYQQLIAYPSMSCLDCTDYLKCGGGCPLQWFIHKPEELIRPTERSSV